MNHKRQHRPWWEIPVFILLVPIVIAVLVLSALQSLALYLLVWATWITRGKDILLVYSDSPHWKEYIEEEILPRIRNRTVVLNWSERQNWFGRFTLAPMLFRHFGGHKEFNPIFIHFRLLRLHRAYRFLEPFRRWRKKNDKRDLDALLSRFYSETGTSAPRNGAGALH
jgi:hypothetical protein